MGMPNMAPMHEAAGGLGRIECGLRSIDRVLRQQPNKFDAVRAAMTAFSAGVQSAAPRVQDYYKCVTGSGEMLYDCNSMPKGYMMTDTQAENVDEEAAAFLTKEGSPLVKQIIASIAQGTERIGFLK